MKKLDDLPKKNIFEVPEGYFERLPGVIQSRTAAKTKSTAYAWGSALRYSLPILLLAAVGIFWFNTNYNTPLRGVEVELENMEPDQLSLFLNDTDLNTDELIETMTWSEDDLNELQDDVYSKLEVTGQQVESLLDEYGDEF